MTYCILLLTENGLLTYVGFSKINTLIGFPSNFSVSGIGNVDNWTVFSILDQVWSPHTIGGDSMVVQSSLSCEFVLDSNPSSHLYQNICWKFVAVADRLVVQFIWCVCGWRWKPEHDVTGWLSHPYYLWFPHQKGGMLPQYYAFSSH